MSYDSIRGQNVYQQQIVYNIASPKFLNLFFNHKITATPLIRIVKPQA